MASNAGQLLGAVVLLETVDWNMYHEQQEPGGFRPAYCTVYGRVVEVGEFALSVAHQYFTDDTVRCVTCIPYCCIQREYVLLEPNPPVGV